MHLLKTPNQATETILKNRSVSVETLFSKNLIDFSELPFVEQAAEIIADGVLRKKRILIVGDYDVDGATSTAVCYLMLANIGARVEFCAANRFKGGYGLTVELVKREVVPRNPDIVITVDSGITSFNGVEYIKNNLPNCKIVITDHHLPKEHVPNADVICNPNIVPDHKLKNLAGVGVVWYLMAFIYRSLNINPYKYLDLVAFGTVADMVHLDQNNRTIIKHGLKLLRSPQGRKGLHALARARRLDVSKIGTEDIAFTLAPLINASGRLEDITTGIKLLVSDDEVFCTDAAFQLSQINEHRKNIETQNIEQVIKHVETDKPSIIYYDETLHGGLVGIVASKLKNKFNKPTIIFSKDKSDDDIIKGSCRSYGTLNIKHVFEQIAGTYPELLVSFGGHAAAAGVSIREQTLEQFKTIFNNFIEALEIQPEEKIIDGVLGKNVQTREFAEFLSLNFPWGQGFPSPLFVAFGKITEYKIVNNKHIKGKFFDIITKREIDFWKFNETEDLELNTLSLVTYRLKPSKNNITIFLEDVKFKRS